MPKKVDTGKMPEKIMAVAQYHSDVVTKLNSGNNKSQIIESALKIVGKHFSAYIDNLARMDHMSFHHVYETGQTGNESARLFGFSIRKSSGSPELLFSFKEATASEKSGQVFKRKAFIMEEGKPLTIVPKNSSFLVFNVEGKDVFTKRSFILNPGGADVKGSFVNAFNLYMQNTANVILKDMGFYDKINNMMEKESEYALSKINKGNIDSKGMADSSINKIIRGLK